MITGDEIRSGRELLGLTQAELASQIGVSFRTIGNWERGETSPQRYEARLRQMFRGHETASSRSISDFSDTELLLEVSRRMSEQRTRHAQPADHPRPSADATSVADPAQRDGATIHPMSPRRPRLLDPDDDDDILEEPYAADTSEDPGEDDQ